MRCTFCGVKLEQEEVYQSLEYLEEGLLCSTHLAEINGWLDYGTAERIQV